MLIKKNARIQKVNGTATFEQLKQTLTRPHICSNCGSVACIGDKNLKNAIITDAISAKDGLYVIKCTGFEERKIKTRDENPSKSSPLYNASIVHPQVRSKIYGK